MKKVLYLLIFALILFSLHSRIPSHAQNQSINSSSQTFSVPQPPGTLQVEIPRVYFVKGTLYADITIKNDTKNDIYDVMYGMQILSPSYTASPTENEDSTPVHPGLLVGYQDYDFFSLKKGETVTKKMTYTLGNNRENGTYKLLVQLRGKDNEILGYQTQSFPLIGNGSFLIFKPQDCTIRVGVTVYEVSDGPIVEKDAQAVISCNVTNPSSNPLTVSYVLEYAVRAVSFYPTSEVEKIHSSQTTVVGGGETKTITMLIPQVVRPQVYEGFLYFTNELGNKVSPIIQFRWTVPGASATILGVNSDKNSYTTGAKAMISVIIDPSADLAWRAEGKGTNLNDARLSVRLVDSQGALCGTAETALPKTSQTPLWPTQKITIPITKDCPSFVVTAEITNNNEPLAVVEKPYGQVSEADTTVKETQSNSKGSNTTGYIWLITVGIGGVLVGVVLVVAFLYKKRKGSSSPPVNPPSIAVLLFLLLFSLLSIRPAFADIVEQPVDAPIENKTILIDWGGPGFWGNVSNFSSVSSTGKSTFTVNDDCSIGNLYMYGYANQAFCGNFHPGLQAQVFIDGQPATVSTVQSPDSTVSTVGNCVGERTENGSFCPGVNGFNLDSPSNGGGLRTGTAAIAVPAAAQGGGQHKIDVRVAAGGRHYSSSGGYFIYTSFWDAHYMNLSTTYTCNKCPAGQNDPHYVCDPGSKSCKPISGCGVNSCTPGQNQCENCDNPNELKPHKACRNNACTTINACGAPSCNSTADCCPAGSMYDEKQDKCIIPACNISCTSNTFCQNAKDGCTACLPNDTGEGSSCKTPPACGTACTKDAQCSGAKNDCTNCSGGKCSAFSENMCGCDGMDFAVAGGADTFFPGSDVSFIAFGVVPGKDWKGSAAGAVTSATITSMTLSLYQSSLSDPNKATRIAQSTAITPEVVENTAAKVRYKVTWNQKIPSTVPSGSLFRVQADIKCSAKPGVLGVKTSSVFDYYGSIVRTIQGLLRNSQAVLGEATGDNQQADTFFPGAKISEKSCKILKFYFD